MGDVYLSQTGQTSRISNQQDLETLKFLRWARENNDINIYDPIFNDFRLDDPKSYEDLVTRIKRVSTAQVAEGVLGMYLAKALEARPIDCGNMDTYFNISSTLMSMVDMGKLADVGRLKIKPRVLDYAQKNAEECLDRYPRLKDWYLRLKQQGRIDIPQSLVEKFFNRFADHPAETLKDTWRKLRETKGPPEIDPKYLKGDIVLQDRAGAQKGFRASDVFVDGTPSGILIIGNPKEGARTSIKIQTGTGITSDQVAAMYPTNLQYTGTLAMQSSDGNRPLGSIATDGLFEPRIETGRQDGLVITDPEGRIKIIDKRRFRLSDITDDYRDDSVFLSLVDPKNPKAIEKLDEVIKKRRLSLLATTLFNPDDPSSKWSGKNNDIEIRLLFTFKNGLFGIYHEDKISTNNMLAIVYRLEGQFGPVDKVVRCDRGFWDTASVYLLDGDKKPRRQTLSMKFADNPSNRINFYTD